MAARRTPDWALGGALVLFSVTLAAIIYWTIRVCGGHFGYPLDDTYIHMAVAKNFALHGVWGTTRYGFTSATSSPLFSFLLSVAYALTGVREITPLVLNIAAAVVLLWCCNRILRQWSFSTAPRFLLLTALVFFLPLPSLTFVSMEHVLHALLTLLFADLAAALLFGNRTKSRKLALLLAITAAIVVTRYEAAFLIALAGLLFLFRGRWRVTLGLALASILPLAIYGWISVAHGWYAVPNSLIIKANLPAAHSLGLFPAFLKGLVINVTQGAHVTLLLVSALLLLPAVVRKHGTVWSYSAVWLILFAGTTALHLLFARVGWFFRYESYLVAFGMIAVLIALQQTRWRLNGASRAAWVCLGVFVLFSIYRADRAIYRAPQSASDIYSQQYQMALFVRQYLNGQTVVLDDVGAVSFLSDARVLDAIGLTDMAPTVARRRGDFSLAWLDDWARENKAAAAILYPGDASPHWRSVRTWIVPGNYIGGADRVGIFAVNRQDLPALAADALAFSSRLPLRVVQK